jgi:hypothetical protein
MGYSRSAFKQISAIASEMTNVAPDSQHEIAKKDDSDEGLKTSQK